MGPLDEIRKEELKSMIRRFFWHQRYRYDDRWYGMKEVEHALFPFGDWDTFDVRDAVVAMTDSGELERSHGARVPLGQGGRGVTDIPEGSHWNGVLLGSKPHKVLIVRRNRDEWALIGECFKCGEFLQWADQMLYEFRVRLLSEAAFEEFWVTEPGGRMWRDVKDTSRPLDKPVILKLSGVRWKRLRHTAQATSACSGEATVAPDRYELTEEAG